MAESRKTGQKTEKQIAPYIKEVTYSGGYKGYEVRYANSFIQTLRVFSTLEEAMNYRAICDDFVNKARFHKQQKTKNAEKELYDFSEYPDNLLNEIGITLENSPNFFEEIVPNFEENWKIASETLTPREADIIMLSYKNYQTLEQIGKKYGITRERVRQIEGRAILKLRYPTRVRILSNKKCKMNLISEKEIDEIRQKIRSELTLEEAMRIVEEHNKKNKDDILDKNIFFLQLSTRAENCLLRANITTVRQICEHSNYELSKIRNMGTKCLKEIRDKLKEYNLQLRKGA